MLAQVIRHEPLDAIERAARLDPETVILNKFEDRAYNRTRFTLVSYVVHDSRVSAIYSPLQQTVLTMVEAAYGTINLALHSCMHPRLGAVDDIVLHPLARASLDEAAWLAKAIAADIGHRFQVFLYGAAHPTGKALDNIRRELGYYRPNFMGNQWAGWALPEVLSVKPDEGPTRVSRARGITMIRACPWVGLYNVPIMSTDVSVARRIARMVSARRGGLLMVIIGSGPWVQSQVEMLAAQDGLDVKQGYFTDSSPEMILHKYLNLISADRAS
ncbi:hypothetical protein V6N11_063458 [Hibiscus sabdariffa]|uniref:Formiminotransferase N-terminal subdomain domain-containing protein n=1 Tax=Hibiscus sabdariffa TaxID=183260 RepID=A0ABR1ZNA8_9ROSI